MLHVFTSNSIYINIDHIRPGPYTACFCSVTCSTLLVLSPLGQQKNEEYVRSIYCYSACFYIAYICSIRHAFSTDTVHYSWKWQVTFTAKLCSHYKLYCSIPSFFSDPLWTHYIQPFTFMFLIDTNVSLAETSSLNLHASGHFESQHPVHDQHTTWKNAYLWDKTPMQ